MTELVERLKSRDAHVAVVGTGYVGTAAAAVLAGAGFTVTGLDINADRVGAINAGRVPFDGDEPGLADLLSESVNAGRLRATLDPAGIAECDAVLISVDTPVGADHIPRHEALAAACATIGSVLKQGALVVVESTVAPGTIDGLVRPTLERATGGGEGTRFHLGNCPERVMPGKLLKNIRTMDRVMGSYSETGAAAMRALYESYVGGRLDDADPLTAELVKTAENAYRDVNIAFANELALICERVGGDVWRVRELVNRSPGRNVLLPGSGVGGHCIPKDPWLLASGLGDGARGSLLASARAVNDGMPAHAAGLAVEALGAQGIAVKGAKVLVLGYSYLEESGDTRNSPSEALMPELRKHGCEVAVHDPFVPEYGGDVIAAAKDADCAIVMVAHRAYRDINLEALAAAMRHPIIVDTRAVFAHGALEAGGFSVRRLGTGSVRTQGATR